MHLHFAATTPVRVDRKGQGGSPHAVDGRLVLSFSSVPSDASPAAHSMRMVHWVIAI